MAWQSVSKRVEGEIMKTDVFCEVLSEERSEAEMLLSLEQAFELFRDFERRYSRFIRDNELWRLNESVRSTVSPELFRILEEASRYHIATGGLFDPSLLSSLEHEGYHGAYASQPDGLFPFSSITLDPRTLTVEKPLGLKIDLGGIGKSFIADKVAAFLGGRYRHFIVDAGGDVFAKGSNRKEGYPYWAIGVEHPAEPERTAPLLLLSDLAAATSGRNRRHWTKKGEAKHHIIDPKTRKSSQSDLLSVTVVADSVTRADVFAKTLFIAGKSHGALLADTLGIAALFIGEDGVITTNRLMNTYVWKHA